MNNIENACFDMVDERDYKYEEVHAEEILGMAELPRKCILDNVEYQNQGLEKITRMMCVYYSTGHVSNEENFQEGSDVRIDCKEFGLKAEELGRLDVNKGAAISNGPRTARDLGYIKGWTKVTSVETTKLSIIMKRPIVVGSNQIDWSLGYKSPYVLGGPKGSAHAIAIIGFDDDYEGGCFVIKQSYGDGRYYEGKQYLKYEDFNLLFPSKYSLEDEEDQIIAHKEKILSEINIPMAKVAFELGIFNGQNVKDGLNREEGATMIVRSIQLVLSGELTLEKLNEVIEKYKN